MEKKKIVLIGPVYPYKGGIAHYTSMLYQILNKKYETELISYKVLYPKFLFKKEQRDFQSNMFQVDGAKYLINTVNPFNIVRVGRKIKRESPDLVIIQWWHPYFVPCYRLLECVLGKDFTKLFICHNVYPHERFPFDRFLTKLVLKQGDAFIVHSKSDEKDLLDVKPNARYRINPHPTYSAFRTQDMTKEQAREKLQRGVEERILLFFGFVREYKGLKHLLKAMPKIRDRLINVKLMIVGAFGDDKDYYMQLIQEERIEDCIEVADGYIPDDEVEKYFAACDLVVLPYESATQSGIVQIAYGFERPVIVTNVGGLPDVVTHEKTGYVVEAGNPEHLANAVIRFFEGDKAEQMQNYVKQEAYRFAWDRMREKIEELQEWN